MESFNPDEFQSFSFPPSLIQKIYELSGGTDDHSKGFLMAYTDQNGNPMVICKAGSPIVEMGIRKALEKYLIDIENVDSPFDIGGDIE